MDAKFLILRMLDILGVGWGTLSIFTVINNTKEAILFILVVAYSIVRIYYTIVFNENRKKREAEDFRKQKGLNGANHNK